ncbi:DUF6415 family natural product biosynthesis protein [Streptomyces sp. NPDC001787]|uniref:DUF6415 family natural product biosynthesis protein n=1 Tax=Streptomyces sp. NPDC001787 TaxID=3154523 RepID=UPI0033195F4A
MTTSIGLCPSAGTQPGTAVEKQVPQVLDALFEDLNTAFETAVLVGDVATTTARLRGWHQRLATIATADPRHPPGPETHRLIACGQCLREEPLSDDGPTLGLIRRLALAVSDLIDQIMEQGTVAVAE